MTMNTAIRMNGNQCTDRGTAEDALAGIRTLPGFLFGYVNSLAGEHRVISFHVDAAPDSPLKDCQQRVPCTFRDLDQTCDAYLTADRRDELIELARSYPTSTVMMSIRETAEAIYRGTPTPATDLPS